MALPLFRLVNGSVIDARLVNADVTSQELQATQQHGVGIIGGLTLSAGAGLSLNVAGGYAQSRFLAAIVGFAANVPNNATSYVILDFADGGDDGFGNTIFTPTLSFQVGALPPNGLLNLGRVTAAAGAITLIETVGRIELARWVSQTVFQVGQNRVVVDEGNGWIGVGGVPARFMDVFGDVFTQTGNGGTGKITAGGNIVAQAHVQYAANQQLLAATKALTLNDPNIQRLTGAASRKVLLPAAMGFGNWFQIFNDNAGGGFNILVRDSGDTTTVATLTPGDVTTVRPIMSGGAPVPPTSTAVVTATSSSPF